MKTYHYIKIWIVGLLFILLVFPSLSISSAVSSPDQLVVCSPNTLSIHAQKTTLETVIKDLKEKCRVEILGLDHRNKEMITFESSGDTEEVIKRLLKQLGEKNCAFEYSRIQLSKVVVMPEGKTTAVLIPDQPPQEVQPPQETQPEQPQEVPQPPAQAVRVFKVLEGTQAVSLGLEEGDLIIEYDGLRITDTQQLMEEVKKKSNMGNVEMVVVRKGEILRYVLSGGKIGIQIGTGIVPQEVMEKYVR